MRDLGGVLFKNDVQRPIDDVEEVLAVRYSGCLSGSTQFAWQNTQWQGAAKATDGPDGVRRPVAVPAWRQNAFSIAAVLQAARRS